MVSIGTELFLLTAVHETSEFSISTKPFFVANKSSLFFYIR